MFESRLAQLLNDTNQLSIQSSNLMTSIKENEIGEDLGKINQETKRVLDRIKGNDNLEVIVQEFLKTLEDWAKKSNSKTQGLFKLSDAKLRHLKSEPIAISKRLAVVVTEIERWFDLTSINRKWGTGTKRRQASDIKTVKEIKEKITEFQKKSLSELSHNVKVLSEQLAQHSKLNSKSTIQGIRLLHETVAEITVNETMLETTKKEIETQLRKKIGTPQQGEDWFVSLNQHLHSRSSNTPQNHPLNEHDVVCILDGELRDFIDSVTDEVVQLDLKNALVQQQHSSVKRMDFSMFNSQKSSISHHILKRLDKQRRIKEGDIKRLFEQLSLFENQIAERHETLSADIPDVLNKHFRKDIFGKYVVHFSPLDEKSYVHCRKNQWNRYPNFFFCIDSITKSSLPRKQLDEIIKLPVSQELCTECLDGRLSIEQALILNSIDFSDTLLRLFREGVDLEFMFSLYDAKDSGWLTALLENSDKHIEIMEVRRHAFNSHLWKAFLKKKFGLWELQVLLNIGFTDAVLSEMCEGELPWEEAENYYAPANDLDERLKNLRTIYGPKSHSESENMTVLSLSDVCKSVGQISEYTLDQPKKTKSKVIRKRRRSEYRLD